MCGHIIDLGPEGGSAGGLVIAEGTPEQVAEVPGSFTGQYLKPLLEKDRQLRAADAETGVKAKKVKRRSYDENHTFLEKIRKRCRKVLTKPGKMRIISFVANASVGRQRTISGCSAVW